MAKEEKSEVEQVHLVENTSRRIIAYQVVVSASPRVTEARSLPPGVCEVPAAEFDAEVKKNATLAHMKNEGELIVHATTKGDGLKSCTEAEVRRILPNTFDLSLLRKWQGQANSPVTATAIINRIATVEAEIKKRGEQLESESGKAA